MHVGEWMDDDKGCSKACNDLIDPLPFKTQTRQCLEPGGDCGTPSLTRRVECNREVGCNGKSLNQFENIKGPIYLPFQEN